MATPDFLAQDDTTFTSIRYFTEADPYYYVIDNRPLQDIETNLKDARKGGGDAARRAAVLNSLGMNVLSGALLPGAVNQSFITGLPVIKISDTVARIYPGAYYEARAISAGNADVVMKQALSVSNNDFTLTSPVSGGTSIIYTVEGEFVELSSGAMLTSKLPYLDNINNYLPSTLINGELKLTLLSGVAANTGSEVPAATTNGKFPIYNITLVQGTAGYTVKMHTNAPKSRRLNTASALIPTTGTAAIANDMSVVNLANAATQGIQIPLSIKDNNLNPYLPLKIKVLFTSSVGSGDVVFRTRYKGFSDGDLTTTVLITGANSAVTVGAANTIKVAEIETVPNTEFATFNAGVWSISKEYLNMVFERVGADAGDTNTGVVSIVRVDLTQ
jgi:hypothetical protein